MGEFRHLYIDMNAFFASVEQHLDPNLRGRPVAITATDGEHGACVAASYEAKAFGIKTGTTVRDARLLCPHIIFRPSRHRTYVRFNLMIAGVLDRYAELVSIRSVDEFQLALSGEARALHGAESLVRQLKEAVAREVGPCLRFSAGIGPSHLLAKIAGKLQKPDGFRWLSPANLPQAIEHLKLDDLPGISTALRDRLFRAGVYDTASLYRLDPRHARAIWRSVEGERFVRALQGMDIPLLETTRGGFGNSKVLAPEFRHPSRAYMVSRWLVEKASARLRRDGRAAGSLSVTISIRNGPAAGGRLTLAPSQDTAVFLRLNRQMWRSSWSRIKGRQVVAIGIHLGNVVSIKDRNGDLLLPIRPAERTPGERLAAAADFLNARFGPGTIRYGMNLPHEGFFERG